MGAVLITSLMSDGSGFLVTSLMSDGFGCCFGNIVDE